MTSRVWRALVLVVHLVALTACEDPECRSRRESFYLRITSSGGFSAPPDGWGAVDELQVTVTRRTDGETYVHDVSVEPVGAGFEFTDRFCSSVYPESCFLTLNAPDASVCTERPFHVALRVDGAELWSESLRYGIVRDVCPWSGGCFELFVRDAFL